MKLQRLTALVSPPRHDKRPTYFIFAGLVFMPLTYDYLSTWDWKEVAARFRYYYGERLPSKAKKQVVIINQVLAHDVRTCVRKAADPDQLREKRARDLLRPRESSDELRP